MFFFKTTTFETPSLQLHPVTCRYGIFNNPSPGEYAYFPDCTIMTGPFPPEIMDKTVHNAEQCPEIYTLIQIGFRALNESNFTID